MQGVGAGLMGFKVSGFCVSGCRGLGDSLSLHKSGQICAGICRCEAVAGQPHMELQCDALLNSVSHYVLDKSPVLMVLHVLTAVPFFPFHPPYSKIPIPPN